MIDFIIVLSLIVSDFWYRQYSLCRGRRDIHCAKRCKSSSSNIATEAVEDELNALILILFFLDRFLIPVIQSALSLSWPQGHSLRQRL